MLGINERTNENDAEGRNALHQSGSRIKNVGP